jgi:GntR family transcriptional regulator, arabinose operon transcriptional repressor
MENLKIKVDSHIGFKFHRCRQMDYLSPFESEEAGEALPKHERLRMQLLQQLQSGHLRPGDALPTENELAVSAKMSRNTVRQALAELERAGLIQRVRGRGTFFHEQALQRVKFGLDIFALVIPDTRGGYYPSLQRGFHAAAAAQSNQVIICDTDNDPLRQADALLQLLDKKVAGVALVPTTNPATPAHQLRPLHERGIPVVFCHRRVEGLQAPLVTFSALEVGRLAGQAMLERGHRRAAFFSAQRAGLSMQYEEGLRQTLCEGGGALPEEFVFYDRTGKATLEHEQFLEKNLVQLLKHPKRPSALFCSFDSEAELAYLLLQRLGVRVPEEVSLIGFGGTWREGALARRLTSVAVDEEELGKTAVGLLAEMRRRERPFNDMTELLLPLSLSQGETLGLAPRSVATPAAKP